VRWFRVLLVCFRSYVSSSSLSIVFFALRFVFLLVVVCT